MSLVSMQIATRTRQDIRQIESKLVSAPRTCNQICSLPQPYALGFSSGMCVIFDHPPEEHQRHEIEGIPTDTSALLPRSLH